MTALMGFLFLLMLTGCLLVGGLAFFSGEEADREIRATERIAARPRRRKT